jgi:ComF family protein
VDRILHGFKYHGQVFWAGWLARQMVRQVLMDGAPLPQALVPVPAHPGSLRERGYNQALELARRVGRCLDIPVDATAVERRDGGVRQARLGARSRRENVLGVFRPAVRPIPAQHVAIVDDIVTTGATAAALTGALQRAGAHSVQLWVVARTLPSGSGLPP